MLHDQVLGREAHLLQLLGVGSGHLRAGDPDRGSLQVVEAELAGESDQLGADAEAGETALDGHHDAGLLNGADDGLYVEGLDGAEVNDFRLDAVLGLELLGGGEGLADTAGEGDHGEVGTGALDLGLAELCAGLADSAE